MNFEHAFAIRQAQCKLVILNEDWITGILSVVVAGCVKRYFLPRSARRTRSKIQNFLGNFNLRDLRALRGLLNSLFLHNPLQRRDRRNL